MNTLKQYFVEPEKSIDTTQFQPANYLRKTFTIDRPIKQAELHITACGLYRAFLNGSAVTEQVFLPGFTYYVKRLQYQTFDISDLITQGDNVIGVMLGDGWYRGKVGINSNRYFYGEKTKLSAMLTLIFADGEQITIPTDTTWKATNSGAIRKSDWKDGEIYDARLELDGWLTSDYDDSGWHDVYPAHYDGELVRSEGEAILEKERFTPEVISTPDGSTVLDFKQNIFGYVAFTVTGERGHTVRLIHGETLDENGNFTLKNLYVTRFGIPRGDPLKQEITYTLKAGTQQYKPSFTAQGFRYVKLENWAESVKAENFTAIAVYSDMPETGYFTCSHDGINQLVHNTRWSQKGNFMDIPTDCPTRERAGWSGDIAAFVEAGSYLMNTNKFLSKWLKDLAAQQRIDGCVHNIIPDVGMRESMNGSAGWGDAAVIIPYALYQFYGNKQVLIDQYDSMQSWLEFVQKRALKAGWRTRLSRNPYRDYIIDTGYHWGEWLEPGHRMFLDTVRNKLLPDAEVATAYYAYSAGLMAEIASILGNHEDAKHYQTLAEEVKTAYRYTFTHDGEIRSDRQCRYVRPIALDLLPEADKAKNAAHLNQMVIENDYKIGTGFLTTPYILNVLIDYGYTDTAYRMMENKQEPGWLYSIDKGATTIWESWHGVDERGVPQDSHNHYAFGAVTAWLFSRVAGIRPLAPAFERILIQPMPGGSLTDVNCIYHSVAGRIHTSWTLKDSEFSLSIDVPVHTDVHLPDGTQHQVAAGQHCFNCELS